MRSILQLRKMRDLESEISSWSPLVLRSQQNKLSLAILDSAAWRSDRKGSELPWDRLHSEHVRTQLEQPHKACVQSPQGRDSFPSHPPAVTSGDLSAVAA